ncbi:hypothetical protein TL16_g02672 [Triparma laevis f. inornata]|uniref:Methyltransferase FkbM domain-containing protein n=1 Tax=Triparma laevis f. inornata TaxID=1714386 RepID=A0A9W6ZZL4_9STRA|nr:hypothetical protein TL16_g02672 [Triparma laevis f. inornata]
MIDGGAHIGFYTHLSLHHGCSALSIEPFPESRNYIEFTAKLNGNYDRLNLVDAVVSDEMRENVNFDGWMVERNSTLSTELKPSSIRIDDLYTKSYDGQKEILYVKLDVEGHELEAYSGLSKLLDNEITKPHHIFIEMNTFDSRVPLSHASQAKLYADMLYDLNEKGYDIFPMEGEWSLKNEFLNSSSSSDSSLDSDSIMKAIIESQLEGCVSDLNLCITEMIAVRSDKVQEFNDYVIPDLLREQEVLRFKMREEVMRTIEQNGGSLKINESLDIIQENTDEGNKIPWATLFVRHPNSLDSAGYQIRYPFDISKTDNYFRRSVCLQMKVTEGECSSVVEQVKKFIKSHSAQQIGFVEF